MAFTVHSSQFTAFKSRSVCHIRVGIELVHLQGACHQHTGKRVIKTMKFPLLIIVLCNVKAIGECSECFCRGICTLGLPE